MLLKHGEIRKALSGLSGIQACVDIGCGIGHVLKLFPQGVTKIGLDFSLQSLRIAKWYLDQAALFARGSATEIPFDAGSADLVTCFEVLEHLPDDQAALREIFRILRPGGFCLLSVPNHYYFREYKDLMGHFRHYDSAILENLLTNNGFEIIRNLNMFPQTNKQYFPIYIFLEACNLFLNKLSRRSRTIYEYRLPIMSKSFYEVAVRPLFIRFGNIEARKNENENSTFVLAQKSM